MGSRQPSVTVVQPPPPQITQPVPNPNVQETSRQLAEAQLEFNPQLVAQQVALQGQYAPQLAQQQYALQQQYGPLYRSLYEQMFPTQTQGLETLAQQALQRIQGPTGYTPEQQAAIDAIRGRAREQLSRNIRTEANLGGGLFGGRRELREDRALGELEQGFVEQDIGRELALRQQALQELIAAGQVIFPQVQQPGVPAFGQGVTPSPDALLAAIMGNYVAQPAAVGFGPSRFSQTSQLIGNILGGVGSIVPG